jgi:hypothetical protein
MMKKSIFEIKKIVNIKLLKKKKNIKNTNRYYALLKDIEDKKRIYIHPFKNTKENTKEKLNNVNF